MWTEQAVRAQAGPLSPASATPLLPPQADNVVPWPKRPLPRLTAARAPLTREVLTVDEFGEQRWISIPAERDLTVYVDKRELVTLMTLGAQPELLVLGYLRNQRLVESVHDIESITVDWDVGAAAVVTRSGIDRIEERTAKRVVTTGCGQGSVFGGIQDELDQIHLSPSAHLKQSSLYDILKQIREQDSTYKSAGSVHGCALFRDAEMLMFVEDVGRHNAVDTIAGWMWLQDPGAMDGGDKVFYTTGRLTSEMVIKSAQMGVPVVVSRSGTTQMGQEVAQRVGLCAIGRATNQRFLCFSHPQRLLRDVVPTVRPQPYTSSM
jgi:FdhD protein